MSCAATNRGTTSPTARACDAITAPPFDRGQQGMSPGRSPGSSLSRQPDRRSRPESTKTFPCGTRIDRHEHIRLVQSSDDIESARRRTGRRRRVIAGVEADTASVRVEQRDEPTSAEQFAAAEPVALAGPPGRLPGAIIRHSDGMFTLKMETRPRIVLRFDAEDARQGSGRRGPSAPSTPRRHRRDSSKLPAGRRGRLNADYPSRAETHVAVCAGSIHWRAGGEVESRRAQRVGGLDDRHASGSSHGNARADYSPSARAGRRTARRARRSRPSLTDRRSATSSNERALRLSPSPACVSEK